MKVNRFDAREFGLAVAEATGLRMEHIRSITLKVVAGEEPIILVECYADLRDVAPLLKEYVFVEKKR